MWTNPRTIRKLPVNTNNYRHIGKKRKLVRQEDLTLPKLKTSRILLTYWSNTIILQISL